MPKTTETPSLTEEELAEAVEQAFEETDVLPPPELEIDPMTILLNRIEAGFEARFAAMERRMELLALKAVEVAMPQAVQNATAAAAAMAANKPPMTMRANVYDNFLSPGGKSAHLGHYRCERMKAVKIQEYDMERMAAYERGDLEWPKDKVGRKVSLQTLTMIQGAYIPALEGHIYPVTENQVACLAWYKTLPHAQGGMPDLYKDDSIEPFRCTVCHGSTDMWPTREGWAAHMLHVHGERVAA